jgi:hypothetical protein
MDSHSPLPEIRDELYNAAIETVRFGPRREFTLAVRRLIWEGSHGRLENRLTYVRFGGVNNLEAVHQFFDGKPHQQSELYTIDYAKTMPSKPGHLFLEIKFERILEQITVECRNLSISQENVAPQE